MRRRRGEFTHSHVVFDRFVDAHVYYEVEKVCLEELLVRGESRR